jgi:hypothetical protein
MIKSILEKNIVLNNIPTFKKNVKIAPICTLIKVLPFLCAWGNLIMLNSVEAKIPKLETLANKEMFMRMSLISDNYELVKYLISKDCMEPSLSLRYYLYSGGSDIKIYNLFNNNWHNMSNNDIYNGIKNNNMPIIKYLNTKVKFPARSYSALSYEKQRYLLKDNDILNYYLKYNINIELALEELYVRKQQNMKFLKSIILIKIFLIRII